MQVDHYLRAQCVNPRCERPADANVPVPIIAPGVVQVWGALRCQGCGHDVKTMKERSDA